MANGKPGRPPLPRTAEEAVSQVDSYLDRHLPGYIKRLSELAEKGDRQALIYLVDRRLGKPVERREDTTDKFTKVLERLARLARRNTAPSLPAGHSGADPDADPQDGVVDAEWTDVTPRPAGDLPGQGPHGQ